MYFTVEHTTLSEVCLCGLIKEGGLFQHTLIKALNAIAF